MKKAGPVVFTSNGPDNEIYSSCGAFQVRPVSDRSASPT